MKIIPSLRLSTWLSALLLASYFILAASTSTFASTGAVRMEVPDVMILISLENGICSVAYSKTVSEAQARADVSRLASQTGWQIGDLSVTTEGAMQSGDNRPTTSADFVANDAPDYYTGNLHIEPIITAFKTFKNLDILYLVPQSFQFRGVRDYEDKYVKIGLTHGITNYEYHVRIKDSSFRALVIPVGGSVRIPTSQSRESSRSIAIILVILLALIVAGLAYFIADRLGSPGSVFLRRG